MIQMLFDIQFLLDMSDYTNIVVILLCLKGLHISIIFSIYDIKGQ